jgi:hypothetical protein
VAATHPGEFRSPEKIAHARIHLRRMHCRPIQSNLDEERISRKIFALIRSTGETKVEIRSAPQDMTER